MTLHVLRGPRAGGPGADDGAGRALDDDGILDFYAAGTGHRSGRPWLRANMVASVDGAAQGPGGLSGPLGTPADHRVFDLLRGLADAVLVGAGTVRAERYTSLPPASGAAAALRRATGQAPGPVLVVPTSTGDVDLDRLAAGGRPVLLVVPGSAPARRLAAARSVLGPDAVVTLPAGPVPAAGDRVGLRALCRALRDRGLPRILAEGGPHLLRGLVEAGLLDELDLTWSPVLAPGAATRVLAGGAQARAVRPLRLGGLLADGDTLLGRWFPGPSTVGA